MNSRTFYDRHFWAQLLTEIHIAARWCCVTTTTRDWRPAARHRRSCPGWRRSHTHRKAPRDTPRGGLWITCQNQKRLTTYNINYCHRQWSLLVWPWPSTFRPHDRVDRFMSLARRPLVPICIETNSVAFQILCWQVCKQTSELITWEGSGGGINILPITVTWVD